MTDADRGEMRREAVIAFAEAWADKWTRIADATSRDGEFNHGWREALYLMAFMLRENVQTLREEAASAPHSPEKRTSNLGGSTPEERKP